MAHLGQLTEMRHIIGEVVTTLDEVQLLQQARALNPEALAQIHDQHYAAIYRFISFKVNDAQACEDLTSEVFTRLLAALRERSAPQNSIRGWLFAAAKNVVREHYRQQAKMKNVDMSENLPDETPNPALRLEQRTNRELLRGKLQELTEEQQHVLALRYGYEMPFHDVAETMGRSVGSVKMLQSRALRRLAKLLGGRHDA